MEQDTAAISREIADLIRGMMKLQFRVLYREFLFRMVDLELLSAQGDMVKLLGQFAGVLFFSPPGPRWVPSRQPPPGGGWVSPGGGSTS